ncbi:MAG: hypothetical protein M0008_11450 [Actinomycetota bacterium]|nr:hypothetical protein [Actinomycetota bacterium]
MGLVFCTGVVGDERRMGLLHRQRLGLVVVRAEDGLLGGGDDGTRRCELLLHPDLGRIGRHAGRVVLILA